MYCLQTPKSAQFIRMSSGGENRECINIRQFSYADDVPSAVLCSDNKETETALITVLKNLGRYYEAIEYGMMGYDDYMVHDGRESSSLRLRHSAPVYCTGAVVSSTSGRLRDSRPP
ncbi:hypothetical protein EVAR_81763_1 [Eumeta japonica]|uniref:Uncharacterized protein n=1 Tax=Eumeta variegata TaxID=151549 RepID=A0A4C1UHF4_EUMVA|nr:hypothetical protein EVAR_81763_1 [Eumeta japonica]